MAVRCRERTRGGHVVKQQKNRFEKYQVKVKIFNNIMIVYHKINKHSANDEIIVVMYF
jgi:hypothetical protein